MLRRENSGRAGALAEVYRAKALFITGSRQIGKSYSIRAFGKSQPRTWIELLTSWKSPVKDALLEARDADDFISRVTLFRKVDCTSKTSCLSDEVQEAPDIMTMAKFLVETECRCMFSTMLGTQFKGVRSPIRGYASTSLDVPARF